MGPTFSDGKVIRGKQAMPSEFSIASKPTGWRNRSADDNPKESV
jgi:hypothetical protein